MADMEARVQKAVEDITGNESLLEMLDEDAAAEMLEWGKSTVTSLVKQTEGMDDAAAELALDQRLKAVRQFMRSAGNWAAGKYADTASRAQLRDKMNEYIKVIYGESARLPLVNRVEVILNQVDGKNRTPLQLIQSFKSLLEELH